MTSRAPITACCRISPWRRASNPSANSNAPNLACAAATHLSSILTMTLELHATPDEVMRAVDALQELGHARQVAENTLFGLALALGECASNIVNHALRRDARQKFRVTLEHTGG